MHPEEPMCESEKLSTREPQRQGMIAGEVMLLREATDLLNKSLIALGEKMRSAMRLDQECSPDKKEDRATMPCELAEVIRVQREKITESIIHVENLIKTIEL